MSNFEVCSAAGKASAAHGGKPTLYKVAVPEGVRVVSFVWKGIESGRFEFPDALSSDEAFKTLAAQFEGMEMVHHPKPGRIGRRRK